MQSVTIRPATVADILAAENLQDLMGEYARESSVPGMPKTEVRLDMYAAMESAGLLKAAGAWCGSRLVGFITIMVTMMPNYGVVAASTGAYFVASEYRQTGAGLRLLKEAEQLARDAGAVGMLVGAPAEGRLSQVLPRVGYAETNRTFFKGLA